MKQPEDARVFLFDIQQACQLITEFTSGLTFPEYIADRKTRSAVERQLGIVGEAIGQIADDLAGLAGGLLGGGRR